MATPRDREPLPGRSVNRGRVGPGTDSDVLGDLQSSIDPATGRFRSVAKPSGRFRERRSSSRTIVEWVFILLLAATVALLVRRYAVQSFEIPSPSMTPTLAVGDRLLVEKLSFQQREVRRTEIIVFEAPPAARVKDGEKDYVKRVIGLPGDRVQVTDSQVIVNGQPLVEPYLPPGTINFPLLDSFQVPIDEYFVMGDNRSASFDSRSWGTVPKDAIIGRVIFRFFPARRIGSVH